MTLKPWLGSLRFFPLSPLPALEFQPLRLLDVNDKRYVAWIETTNSKGRHFFNQEHPSPWNRWPIWRQERSESVKDDGQRVRKEDLTSEKRRGTRPWSKGKLRRESRHEGSSSEPYNNNLGCRTNSGREETPGSKLSGPEKIMVHPEGQAEALCTIISDQRTQISRMPESGPKEWNRSWGRCRVTRAMICVHLALLSNHAASAGLSVKPSIYRQAADCTHVCNLISSTFLTRDQCTRIQSLSEKLGLKNIWSELVEGSFG